MRVSCRCTRGCEAVIWREVWGQWGGVRLWPGGKYEDSEGVRGCDLEGSMRTVRGCEASTWREIWGQWGGVRLTRGCWISPPRQSDGPSHPGNVCYIAVSPSRTLQSRPCTLQSRSRTLQSRSRTLQSRSCTLREYWIKKWIIHVFVLTNCPHSMSGLWPST